MNQIEGMYIHTRYVLLSQIQQQTNDIIRLLNYLGTRKRGRKINLTRNTDQAIIPFVIS